MSTIRVLRAQFEAEQHMAWQALHLPESAANSGASSSSSQPAAPTLAPLHARNAAHTPSLPVAPFPGPPAYPGDDSQIPTLPVAPFPGPPVYPGDDSQIPTPPVAPFPGPPAYPGTPVRTCWVRFLHAAFGYDPLRVLIGQNVFAPSLSYANMTEYRLVREGFRTVTVTSASGGRPILLRSELPFRAGEMMTVAIIDGENGLEFIQLSDSICKSQMGGCGAIRMANLSLNSPPLDMRLYDGDAVFTDVRYREVTPFQQMRCGNYLFYLIRTAPQLGAAPPADGLPLYEPLVSFDIDVRQHATYTCYVLGRVGVPGQILQILVAEDE